MSITNQHDAQARDLKAIAGVDKYFGNVASVTIGGKAYTPIALKAVFQAEIDAENQLGTLRAQLKQLLGATQVARTDALTLHQSLRTFILGTAGAQAVQMLEDFGILTKLPNTPDTATKATAVAKAKATRAARHTMGSKQRKAIKAETPASPPAPKA